MYNHQEKVLPDTFDVTCPHCATANSYDAKAVVSTSYTIEDKSDEDYISKTLGYLVNTNCRNKNCNTKLINYYEYEYSYYDNDILDSPHESLEISKSILIEPQSSKGGSMLNDTELLPNLLQVYYKQAKLISNLSPVGTVAVCRMMVEFMANDKGKELGLTSDNDRKNLGHLIDHMKESLEEIDKKNPLISVLKTMSTAKDIGNKVLHTNEGYIPTKEEATLNLELIEVILQELYIIPMHHHISNATASLLLSA